jgi:hypothetical protein
MRHHSAGKTLGLLLILLIAMSGAIQAQVKVDISLRRSLYMIYEPIICIVSITNLSGADLELEDLPEHKWFGFQVETLEGRPLAPINAEYRNQPISIQAGQTVRRSVNLTPLFPMSEFGAYRIRATVFVPRFNRYFSSLPLSLEITEGRVLWEQTVGVPPDSGASGSTRLYQLLAHRLPSSTMLYLRVQDKENGIIYCTTQLGRYVAFGKPVVIIDPTNEVHVLHNLAPKEFLYSHFDINGKVKQQQAYQQWGDKRPNIVRTSSGEVQVVDGSPYDPRATPPEKKLPGLSERPVPLPTAPKDSPTPRSSDSPESLLSN